MLDRDKIILLVDDSPLIISHLRESLEGIAGVGKVVAAASYEEALELLAGACPDIAVLDINLPGASGIELLRYIKSEYPSIHVVMLSNQSGEFYKSRCKALGASYFIDKSSEFDLVAQVIASFL